MNPRLLAFSTAPSLEEGERLARVLVERGLAACVNLVPGARSIYAWEGQLRRDDECLLLIKTNQAGFAELQRTLLAEHPYDVPELIAVKIEAGHAAYLEWLDQALGVGGGTE